MKQEKRISDSVDLSARRREGESFSAYKKRMRANNHLLRVYLGGHWFWRGDWGTYVRESEGK